MQRVFCIAMILALVAAVVPTPCSACCVAAHPSTHACCEAQHGAMHAMCPMPGTHEALPGQMENKLAAAVMGGAVFGIATGPDVDVQRTQILLMTGAPRSQPPLVLRT